MDVKRNSNNRMPGGRLERIEKLEQLNALENGHRIFETPCIFPRCGEDYGGFAGRRERCGGYLVMVCSSILPEDGVAAVCLLAVDGGALLEDVFGAFWSEPFGVAGVC